jgi:hypothetical protein
MKKLRMLMAAIFFVTLFNASAQDYSKLKDINISDSVSCVNAQSKVLECSNYLLTTPCKEDLAAMNAILFIIDWMGATANYRFTLEGNLYKIIKTDTDLAARYYAALTKTAIENNYTEAGFDLQLKATSAFLDYCELPKNKVNITKKLQKYIDAKKANRLKELIEPN